MFENKLNDYQKVKVKEIISKTFLREGTWVDAAETIEAEIGVKLSKPQIYVYRKQEEERWLADSQQATEQRKAKQLAEIAHAKKELWVQWDRSKKDAQTITTESIGISEEDREAIREFTNSGDSNTSNHFLDDPRNPDRELENLVGKKLEVKTKETIKTSGQCGDARYIQQLNNLLQREADLLGLDAPKRVEISWEQELIINNIPQDKIDRIKQETDEYNKRIAAILADSTDDTECS